MKKFLVIVFFWIIFVVTIHMIVFVSSGKTVAQLLGFLGVMGHAFGSLYLARLVTRRILDRKLPSGQSRSLAQARADAIDEAIKRGDLDEDKYNEMIRKLKGE